MKKAEKAVQDQRLVLEQAIACLAQVTALEEQWAYTKIDEHGDKKILDEIIEQCEMAKSYFDYADMHWMSIWTVLIQADIMANFAQSFNGEKDMEITEAAMNLTQSAMLEIIKIDGPEIKIIRALYLSLIKTLFSLRALFEQPDQIAAMDALIRESSYRYGEIEAWGLSLRSNAGDQLVAAAVLNFLQEFEDSPEAINDLHESSQAVLSKGIQNLQFCGGSTSSSIDELIRLASGAAI